MSFEQITHFTDYLRFVNRSFVMHVLLELTRESTSVLQEMSHGEGIHFFPYLSIFLFNLIPLVALGEKVNLHALIRIECSH